LRSQFGNLSPEFSGYAGRLKAELASLINYLRANFAPNAPKVTAEEVVAQRAGL
jgi:hypothetical protein